MFVSGKFLLDASESISLGVNQALTAAALLNCCQAVTIVTLAEVMFSKQTNQSVLEQIGAGSQLDARHAESEGLREQLRKLKVAEAVPLEVALSACSLSLSIVLFTHLSLCHSLCQDV